MDRPSSSPCQSNPSNPLPQSESIRHSEVPYSAHTSLKLPFNIKELESSTPLPTPLIMPYHDHHIKVKLDEDDDENKGEDIE